MQHNSNMDGNHGENAFNEHYQAMGQQEARQTHGKFPTNAGRFNSDHKRPGSAQARKKALPALNTRKK